MSDTSSMTDLHTPLTLVLGGTKSGKSAYAEHRVMQRGGRTLYIATADTSLNDPSMERRIAVHRARRPDDWATLEAPYNVGEDFLDFPQHEEFDTILLDCITLWTTNLLFMDEPIDPVAFENRVKERVSQLIDIMRRGKAHWVVVSGEVGLGGTHSTALERTFCDGLGLANQLLSQAAEEAYLVVASRPLRLPPPDSAVLDNYFLN